MNATLSQWQSPSRPLYHYTNGNVLVKILDSKKIRATNIFYLNDAQEYIYAAELLRQRIEQITPSGPSARRLLQDVESTLAHTDPRREDSSNSPGIYVTSFADDGGHELNQWRVYAPNGNGCSIGFDFNSSLRNVIEPQGFRLVQCEYARSKQEELIDQLLNDNLTDLNAELNEDDRTNLASEIYSQFLALAPKLKNQDFSAEKEWRLVSELITTSDIAPRYTPQGYMKSDKVKFREGKATMIPYLEITLEAPPNPLELFAVWIGPSPYPFLSRNAAQIAAIAAGCRFQTHPPVQIWKSGYRAGGSQM